MDTELEDGWEAAFEEMDSLFTEAGLWEVLGVVE